MRIGIIGTAGRRDDAKHLDRATWHAMMEDAGERIFDLEMRDNDMPIGISGGAAWADHLAVRLFLTRTLQGLRLYLPAPIEPDGFVETGERYDAGRTANKLHRAFQEVTGINAPAEICTAIGLGAHYEIFNGFKVRNTRVAREADMLLAYTCRGDAIQDCGPNDAGFTDHTAIGMRTGGTSDTWDKARSAQRKIHVPVHCLPLAQPEAAPAL